LLNLITFSSPHATHQRTTTCRSSPIRSTHVMLAPASVHHTVTSALTRCALFGPATISRRACIDGTAFVAHLLRYLIRSPWISLSHAPSAIVSRRGAPTRIGLVLEGGRGVCAYFGDGLGCCRSTACGYAWAAGTTGDMLMPPQALVVCPAIAVLANTLAALNGLSLLAPAALLGDLANALDSSTEKALVRYLRHLGWRHGEPRRRFGSCWHHLWGRD